MAGRATTNGVVAFQDAIAPEDSAVVGNLRRAGAIIIGRTNTPAFSWRWFTDNDLHGQTLNPWSAGHTPGGSSGGAAAAVAAGIGAIAHGNDIGGSVRYPAYACGVAGLRPSLGRIPAFNPGAKAERSLSAQILSTQGPLARRVGDLRLALAAMAAPDWRDPWQAPVPLEGPPLPGPIRVALCADPMGTGVHPAVAAAVAAAGAALARAGYAVEEAAPPGFAAVAADWDAFIHAEATVFMREGFQTLADAKARAIFAEMAGTAVARPARMDAAAGGQGDAPARLGGLDADHAAAADPGLGRAALPAGPRRDRLRPGVQGAGAAVPDGASGAAERLGADRGGGWPADGRAGGGAALAGGPGAGGGGGDRGRLPDADADRPAPGSVTEPTGGRRMRYGGMRSEVNAAPP